MARWKRQPPKAVKTLRKSALTIYFVGGLNVALGIAASVSQIEVLQQLGFGWISALVGAIYIVLGYFVQFKRSTVALSIAFTLFILDTTIWIFLIIGNSGRIMPSGIVSRIALIWFMWQGFDAIQEIEVAGKNLEEEEEKQR